jgi:hypothetical protein
MKYLDRRIFRLTAEKRFSLLDKDYILKKFKDEKFPIEGNNLLGNQLYEYIKKNFNELKSRENIVLIDIGSAGGALTTIFALKALNLFGLLDKTKIIQVDLAKKALDSTMLCDFSLPKEMILEYGLDSFEKNGVTLKKVLSNSEYLCCDFLKLPSYIKDADICLSGFTHHHMNLLDKEIACKEMEKITRQGGFIGIVDESLNYGDYLNWLNFHKNEKNSSGITVPIAVESFISMEEHINFLKKVKITNKLKTDKFYCFSGIKA